MKKAIIITVAGSSTRFRKSIGKGVTFSYEVLANYSDASSLEIYVEIYNPEGLNGFSYMIQIGKESLNWSLDPNANYFTPNCNYCRY